MDDHSVHSYCFYKSWGGILELLTKKIFLKITMNYNLKIRFKMALQSSFKKLWITIMTSSMETTFGPLASFVKFNFC